MATADDKRYNDQQWRKFRDRWNRVRRNLADLPKEAQKEAATKLAKLLREYLKAGVRPGRSLFTMLMKGSEDDRAMVGLARFVTIEVTDKYAMVTFRSEKRRRIAALLEYGYTYVPTTAQWAFMWAKIKDNDMYYEKLASGELLDNSKERLEGLPPGTKPTPLAIVVAARPFMHIISNKNPKAREIVQKVTEKHLKKALKPVT